MVNPVAATPSTLSSPNESNGFDAYDSRFRTHFDGNYTKSGYTYDQYQTHYRYGYNLANDSRSSGREWPSVEADLRNRWSETTMGPWEQFRDSVRYAWERARRM
ncbi:MAG: hypothetical protein Fur005_49450 [Roseiflexaceae bacterium]